MESPSLSFDDFDRSKHWKTATGELIALPDLTDRHLTNCLRLLHERAEVWLYNLAHEADGVGAPLEAISHLCEQSNTSPSEFLLLSTEKERAGPLLGEWTRRGLAVDSWVDGEFEVALFQAGMEALAGKVRRGTATSGDFRYLTMKAE